MDKKETNKDILNKAYKRAIGGGLAGSSAMIIQITSLQVTGEWLKVSSKYMQNSLENANSLRIFMA